MIIIIATLLDCINGHVKSHYKIIEPTHQRADDDEENCATTLSSLQLKDNQHFKYDVSYLRHTNICSCLITDLSLTCNKLTSKSTVCFNKIFMQWIISNIICRWLQLKSSRNSIWTYIQPHGMAPRPEGRGISKALLGCPDFKNYFASSTHNYPCDLEIFQAFVIRKLFPWRKHKNF